MKLNDQLIEMNLRELAAIDYDIKRLDEKKAYLYERRDTVAKAIADLRHAK